LARSAAFRSLARTAASADGDRHVCERDQRNRGGDRGAESAAAPRVRERVAAPGQLLGDTVVGEQVHREPVGFQNSATVVDLGFYAARSYSLREAAEDGSALDPHLGEISDRVIEYGRVELALR
jgi:hypothetical protein